MYLFWTRKMVEGGTKLDIQIRKEVLSAKIESAKSGGGKRVFKNSHAANTKSISLLTTQRKKRKTISRSRKLDCEIQ